MKESTPCFFKKKISGYFRVEDIKITKLKFVWTQIEERKFEVAWAVSIQIMNVKNCETFFFKI